MENAIAQDDLLRMEGIEKLFPGVHALNNCRFAIRRGEVHALVGENGAGKSTLMKVLTGIYKRDGGTIHYKGREIDISSPEEAQALGIGIIHQELNLMPHLTVAENIFIGREPMRGPFLDKKKANEDARKLLNSLRIDIDPTIPCNKLSVAKQQMVEIAKALSFDSELLVMDEPRPRCRSCSASSGTLKSAAMRSSTSPTGWMSCRRSPTASP